ncbi:MAG: hypothetical protein QM534_05550 [Sediminibacterium sp.]|nr:hypothetical protein [Sediminibacterium sp.]
MPTRLNLAFALLCFFGLKLSSQLSHGFYESKRKDSIFVFNDTLWFKIKNTDAFNTFAVGKSVLSKKTKKNRVKLHCISLLNELTIVMPIPFRTEDSILTFRFCYKNDSPIGYSTITLLDKMIRK